MIYIKGALGTMVVAGILWAGWTYYSSRLNTQKMPEHYELITELETKGYPEFEGIYLDGSPFHSDQLKDKVVILNFWASWCEPCVKEYPSMKKLVAELDGDVILVAVTNDEIQEDVTNFLKAFGDVSGRGDVSENVEILWDPERKIANQFGVVRLPESFIFNKQGRLERKIIGYEEWYGPQAVAYFRALAEAESR